VQEFKISCANEEYSNVLEFLRTDEYKIPNIFLKDIDVTMDYAGSFEKDELIHHLTTNEGFRMQGCTTDADRTILDMGVWASSCLGGHSIVCPNRQA
jgi:hypothetical protein